MLWRILQVFMTKKCTHCKTSRTLRIDVFEIPDGKNIGKLFSKYKLLFLDQANSSSHPSQILIRQFPIPTGSLPHSPSNFCLVNWNPSSNNPHLVLHWFPYFVLPHLTMRHHTSIRYAKSYAKPNWSNLLSSYIQIIIPYCSSTLPIKKISLSEPLPFQS